MTEQHKAQGSGVTSGPFTVSDVLELFESCEIEADLSQVADVVEALNIDYEQYCLHAGPGGARRSIVKERDRKEPELHVSCDRCHGKGFMDLVGGKAACRYCDGYGVKRKWERR